jgi:hypothetical protein
MNAIINDIKYAVRQLIKSPGFTSVSVISLALGIGAGTAVFSLVNAILLRSLPVPYPHELRVLHWSGIDKHIPSLNSNISLNGNLRTAESVSHPMFLSMREQVVEQADIFGYSMVSVAARARAEAFGAAGMMVSDNFLTGLGVRPLFGRLFNAEDRILKEL